MTGVVKKTDKAVERLKENWYNAIKDGNTKQNIRYEQDKPSERMCYIWHSI